MGMDVILDKVIEKVKQEIIENLKKALNEALNNIDIEYNKVLNSYSIKITEILNNAKERIEGERARLEVEVKRAIMNEKEKWLNQVYSEALSKLDTFQNSSKYKEGLKNILNRELRENTIIYCSPNDEQLIKDLTKGKNVIVKKDFKIKGGIKLEYTDQGLVKDYTLDLILNQIFEAMKGKIAEILFGEL
jgi:V/A-type H+-transporting ATPase subunit E